MSDISPMPDDGATPLVGRERELGILRARLTAALAGSGSLALIGGEAGIGKTALAEVVCREAGARGAWVLIGRCYDLTETPPYGPWIELFRHYQPGDSPPSPEAFAQRGTIVAVTSQAVLFQQALDFFTALSAARPLVLVLDDLHWADPASLDLLRFLARNVSLLPLLVLVTYRSDELTRDDSLYALLPALVHEAQPHRLTLRSLGDEDTRALVRARYRLADGDTARLAAYLYAHGQGNPFFIGELLRTLEEDATLRLAEGGVWTLGTMAGARVPPLVRQVIEKRLARLDVEARRLLAIAAVIGQEVPLPIWATVGEVDEEALITVVERAVGAHLLLERPNGESVQFVHALVRETLYEGIRAIRRKEMHRVIADALERGQDPDPDGVAYHFQRANDDRAAAWLIKAGERAQQSWAWITAAERYESAVRVLDRANTKERARLLYLIAVLRQFVDPEDGIGLLDEAISLAGQEEDPVLIACATTVRGCLLCYAQRFREGLLGLEAGAMALDSLPETDRQRIQTLDVSLMDLQPENRWDGVAAWYALLGRYQEARNLSERLIIKFATVPGEAGTERGPQSGVYRALGIAYAGLGMPDDAHGAYLHLYSERVAGEDFYSVAIASLDEFERVLLAYRADRVAERQALVAQAEDSWNRAGGVYPQGNISGFARLLLLILEGHWEEAHHLAVTVRSTNSLPAVRRVATRTLGFLAHHRGESDLAWSLVREIMPDGPTTAPGGTRFLDAQIAQQLAFSLAIAERALPTARAWLEAHDHWLAWSAAVHGRAEAQLGWSHYYRAAGDRGRATPHATEALVHASDPRQPLALLAAHRLLGELDTDAARFAHAQTHLDAALTLADACAAPFERALTFLALAELCAAEDRRDEALAYLDEARAICLRLGAKSALARADALAAHLAPHVLAHHPADLSAREVEVLRLVAAGHTNHQIAETLFLSERTVHVHVRNIFAKTGTSNRAGAAAFAFRHNLA